MCNEWYTHSYVLHERIRKKQLTRKFYQKCGMSVELFNMT
jgi:hypothetical protein